PFGPLLDQTIKDKTVSGRGLKVQRFQWRVGDDLSAVKKCQLLYLSTSLGDDADGLIAALARLPILLIGEGTEFAKSGGALGFVMEEGRIVFWANRKAAENANLQLSSQLLKLARPVEGAAVGQDRDTPKGKTGA
ncbi:MAG: YfiR family protein, partial [Pseudomonadota bacterium]